MNYAHTHSLGQFCTASQPSGIFLVGEKISEDLKETRCGHEENLGSHVLTRYTGNVTNPNLTLLFNEKVFFFFFQFPSSRFYQGLEILIFQNKRCCFFASWDSDVWSSLQGMGWGNPVALGVWKEAFPSSREICKPQGLWEREQTLQHGWGSEKSFESSFSLICSSAHFWRRSFWCGLKNWKSWGRLSAFLWSTSSTFLIGTHLERIQYYLEIEYTCEKGTSYVWGYNRSVRFLSLLGDLFWVTVVLFFFPLFLTIFFFPLDVKYKAFFRFVVNILNDGWKNITYIWEPVDTFFFCKR